MRGVQWNGEAGNHHIDVTIFNNAHCSCGAMTHKTKDCVERPRKTGAKWTQTEIAADEKIQDLHLETFDAKKDRWNGYDTAEYARVMDM